MIPQNPRQNIYGPKTLAVMDQAFVAIWQVLRADDPFRDSQHLVGESNGSKISPARGDLRLFPAAPTPRELRQQARFLVPGYERTLPFRIHAADYASQRRW